MFRESLLESSRSIQRKSWPMIAAFIGEVIVAGVLVLIPLLTTGVIPVSAHVISCPLGNVRLASEPSKNNLRRSAAAHLQPAIVNLGTERHVPNPMGSDKADEFAETGAPPMIGDPHGVPDLPFSGDRATPVPEPTPRRVRPSVQSEAQLLKKVEPIYPHIAVLTGKQGDVKLHAFIAKDGSIESLTVISGDPLLVNAAVDAVKQWRYRPYLLNGEPVEVETFITVSFKGIRN